MRRPLVQSNHDVWQRTLKTHSVRNTSALLVVRARPLQRDQPSSRICVAQDAPGTTLILAVPHDPIEAVIVKHHVLRGLCSPVDHSVRPVRVVAGCRHSAARALPIHGAREQPIVPTKASYETPHGTRRSFAITCRCGRSAPEISCERPVRSRLVSFISLILIRAPSPRDARGSPNTADQLRRLHRLRRLRQLHPLDRC
jgi:hypothetical protein